MKEYADNSKNWRNIGLGVFGYADMLMALGLTYGEPEAIEFTNHLFDFMMRMAMYYNHRRGLTKRSYPEYNRCTVEQSAIYQKHASTLPHGSSRNCSLLSIAPTGSIGTMMGLSGGIEPEFALSYTRRTDNLDDEYKIEARVVKDYRKVAGDTSDTLPPYFVTSSDINYKNRIDTQSVIQDHVDTAISSTINLPKETTKEEIEKLYLYAWQRGLKGVTIFRDGCKRFGILTTEDKPNNDESNDTTPTGFKRGDIVQVSDDLIGYKRKIVNGCGDFMEQIFFDDFTGEPLENYIAMGDNGGCEKNMEAISRLISLCWRAGVAPKEVVSQLKKVRACPAYRTRHLLKGDTSKGTSCPSALGFAIDELCSKIHDRCFADEEDDVEEPVIVPKHDDKPNITSSKPTCPECGAEVLFEGGCVRCAECGWSRCD